MARRDLALILAFVARRLLAEPVGLVFATRDPGGELGHVPSIEVHGLRNGDARALLGSVVRFPLDARVREHRAGCADHGEIATAIARAATRVDADAAGGRIRDAGSPGSLETDRGQLYPETRRSSSRRRPTSAARRRGRAGRSNPLLLQRACERLGVALSAIDVTRRLAGGRRARDVAATVGTLGHVSAGGRDRRAAHYALAQVTDRDIDPD